MEEQKMNNQTEKKIDLVAFGYIFLFSRIFVSVLYNASVKMLKISSNINATDIAFYSSIFGIIFLLLIFPFREKIFGKTSIRSAGFWPLIFASLFGGALYLIFYNEAVARLQVGRVSVTYYVYPLFLYIIGSIVIDKNIKKAFNPRILLGIIICLLGVFFTCYTEIFSQAASSASGYVYVALSASCMIIFSLIAKKYKISTYWFLLIGQFISVSIAISKYASAAVSTGNKINITPINSGIVLCVLILFGILANDLREFFRIKSVEYLPISKISTWNYFSPVMAGLSGVIFFHDHMTKFDYLGYILVIGGNIIANYKSRDKLINKKISDQPEATLSKSA